MTDDPWARPFTVDLCNCADGSESPAFPENRREHAADCWGWDDYRAEVGVPHGARWDECEALVGVIERGWRDPAWGGLPIERKLAAAVIAAGYRRHPEPEITEEMVEDLRQRLYLDVREVIGEAFADTPWLRVDDEAHR